MKILNKIKGSKIRSHYINYISLGLYIPYSALGGIDCEDGSTVANQQKLVKR